MRLIFFLILFGVAYLGYHLYGKKLLKQKPADLIKPLLILVGILLILAVVTGRANAIFAVIGGLIASAFRIAPLLLRFYPQIRDLLYKFGINTPAGPGASRVKTATLDATLDPMSGRIDGLITSGQFEGQTLSSMPIEDIAVFYKFCSDHDPQALRIIEAFVQQEFPEQKNNGNWNASQSNQQAPASADASMSVSEACEILGVTKDASKQEISYAHRKLMAKLHPDKGGSTFLATRVNVAKDTLIARLQSGQT